MAGSVLLWKILPSFPAHLKTAAQSCFAHSVNLD